MLSNASSLSELLSIAQENPQLLLSAISNKRLERSLLAFVREAWPVIEPGTTFIPGRHIVAMCLHLEAVVRGEIEDLVINAPPGMSKSKILSVCFPAWVWTFNPAARFLCASYEQSLATRDNVACRELLESPWYQSRWGVRLKADDNQKMKFTLEEGGWRMATTPRGRGTGEHPDFVVCDDPHNVKQAESDVERTFTLNWWDRTIGLTRGVSRKSKRIIGMQRLNELDLSGHVRATRDWAVHLVLPMTCDPSIPSGSFRALDQGKNRVPTDIWADDRKEGELLCPELIPPLAVERMKATMLSKASGQLQQNPLPDSGAVLSRSMFRTYSVDSAASDEPGGDEVFTLLVPTGNGGFKERRYTSSQCWWYQAADTAEKDGEENDYTAIGTFLLTPGGELLVYDVFREKLLIPKIYPTLLDMRKRYPRILVQAIEERSSGTGIVQVAAEQGTPIFPLKMKGSKKERGIPMAAWYSTGRIFHKAGASWRQDMEDELVGFPDAHHDDMWDMMAYGVQLLHQGVLASFANLRRPLNVWPMTEEEAKPLGPIEDTSGSQFDLARQLGII